MWRWTGLLRYSHSSDANQVVTFTKDRPPHIPYLYPGKKTQIQLAAWGTELPMLSDMPHLQMFTRSRIFANLIGGRGYRSTAANQVDAFR